MHTNSGQKKHIHPAANPNRLIPRDNLLPVLTYKYTFIQAIFADFIKTQRHTDDELVAIIISTGSEEGQRDEENKIWAMYKSQSLWGNSAPKQGWK